MSKSVSLDSTSEANKPSANVITYESRLEHINEVPTIDPMISARIVSRYDRLLLPLLAAMYLCNSLDKSEWLVYLLRWSTVHKLILSAANLANVKTDKFDINIGLVG
jgi:hypothetical protein